MPKTNRLLMKITPILQRYRVSNKDIARLTTELIAVFEEEKKDGWAKYKGTVTEHNARNIRLDRRSPKT